MATCDARYHRLFVFALVLFVPSSLCSSTSTARLVSYNGQTQRSSGLLQMRVNSVWKYVCDDSFTREGANLACREMGYHYGVHRNGASVGRSDFYDDVQCSGFEARLTDCPRRSGHNCGTTEGVRLTCYLRSARLTDYNGHAIKGPTGFLQMRAHAHSHWKFVCDDGFGNNNHAHHVACKEMGYDYARTWNTQTVSSDSFYDDVVCNGRERRLTSCARRTGDDCSSTEGVWLHCDVKSSTRSVRLTDSSGHLVTGSSGLLQMLGGTRWKFVCDDFFDSNSKGPDVACRELGYDIGVQRSVTTPWDSFYDNVKCSGRESKLAFCPRTTGEDCSVGQGVWLTCYTRSVRLVASNGNVLKNAKAGLLQMSNGNVWKYVCDDHFDANNNGANVACRELGYSQGGQRSASTPSSSFYDDIQCTGNEARLASCPRSSSHNCGTSEGVYITCS